MWQILNIMIVKQLLRLVYDELYLDKTCSL